MKPGLFLAKISPCREVFCDPAGIGSALQNPELGPEPFTNRTQASASIRIPMGIKQKNLTFL